MRYVYLLIGLVMVAGAAWFMVHRLNQEPDLVQKYERIIQGESPAKTAEAEKRTRSASPQSGGGGDEVQLFQMALDVGNLVVGIIGIILMLRSMGGGRRQPQS